MKLINLGCGNNFHDEWINIDLLANNEKIISCNLLNGIPFPDNDIDVVFNSHLLEHFSKKQGEIFIKECFRVLKPGGIIRVAVPDLEQIIKEYINILTRIDNNEIQAVDDYNWILLELYDQTVRNVSGGMMGEYFCQPSIPNEEYVYSRIGNEGRNLRYKYLNSVNKTSVLTKDKLLVTKLLSSPSLNFFFEKLISFVYKKKYEQIKHFCSIGQFRESGEIHQWMYDKYSLNILLQKVGFKKIIKRTAFESYIERWPSYNLDTMSDGTIRKPDSLFIEALK